ncbi:hypothetical protein [Rhizobium alvei]|uniref:Uncharacterized protein n=1 Tax=Rhizobium alvei TaxID=1132659 RepID=A0ABT8YL80_9HYPH|nr:hypothetical protein [Rhizobium alvei]MDO6964059.1 hypothetical protein [Rhizobium alvei]
MNFTCGTLFEPDYEADMKTLLQFEDSRVTINAAANSFLSILGFNATFAV